MLREDLRSTIWMIGCDLRVEGTATVFFVRLPFPLRAAGRAVITLFRSQKPPGLGSTSTLRIRVLACQCRQSHSFTSWSRSRITRASFPEITVGYGNQR